MTQPNPARLQVLDSPPRIAGPRLGRLLGWDEATRIARVDFAGNLFGPVPARLASRVTADALHGALRYGHELLLLFEANDARRPIVVDCVAPNPAASEASAWVAPASTATAAPSAANAIAVQLMNVVSIDGDHVMVDDGQRQLPARVATTLRNLSDPVVVQALPDGSAVVVGQLFTQVMLEPAGAAGADVVLKGDCVRIEAQSQLVIATPNCTIRLDAHGKLESTAEQIVSRARGANKVQGGSVHLN
jgi:Domain of unknown function (DUF6484)